MSAIKEAIKRLHRQKDEAYRGAWKRRGELFSIIPNIARKVDRLTAFSAGADNIPGETVLDTAIDLYVYCIKYALYLADSDPLAAADLKISGTKPFSDNHENFDQVLERAEISTTRYLDVDIHIQTVSENFEKLWPAVEMGASKASRFLLVMTLITSSEHLLSAIIAQHSEATCAFIANASLKF